MEEERLTNLETKISYQEQIIEDLNVRVIEQQEQIDKLEKQLKALASKFTTDDDSDVVDISLEVPPPHY